MKTLLIYLTILLLVLNIRCKSNQDDDQSVPDNPQDNAQLDGPTKTLIELEPILNEMLNTAISCSRNSGQIINDKSFLNCSSVDKSTTGTGYELAITFNGSKCSDLLTKKGRLLVDVDVNTFNVMINANNYEVDGKKVNGSFFFQREIGDGKTYKLTTLSGRLNKKNGEAISFAVERKSTWKKGEDTPSNPTDDMFEISTGEYDLITSFGVVSSKVTANLIFNNECVEKRGYLPVSGRITHEYTNSKTSVTNFGDGGCNSSVVTE